jgi:hypothetical protein
LKKFNKTGSVTDKPHLSHPSVPEKIREVIIAKAHASPGKLIRHTTAKLDIPKSTVHKVLHA